MNDAKVSSTHLVDKAILAAVSSIEIYNKPDFKYREETFAILMANAWELLLKAKVLKDSGENFDVLVVRDNEGNPKLTRSQNPRTHEALYLARKLKDSGASNLGETTLANIELLIEVRDNAIHFVNLDLHFSRRVQDIGTASLKNFMELAVDWFGVDFSRFNFYLMPISFYHGFEAAQPITISGYTEQMKRFLQFVAEQEKAHESAAIDGQQVTVCIKTEFVRSQSADALPIRMTNDPSAPVMQLKEEDVRKRWPLTYDDVVARCRNRYSDFKTDEKFNRLKRTLEAEGHRYCFERYLDPAHPRPPRKKFYSPDVIVEFDKHYCRKPVPKIA